MTIHSTTYFLAFLLATSVISSLTAFHFLLDEALQAYTTHTTHTQSSLPLRPPLPTHAFLLPFGGYLDDVANCR